MHSCLYITEILSIIFTTLHRSHLPVVARICRAWEKPALDVLWKSIDDLLPLIDLFPQDSRTLSLPRVCTPPFYYGIRLTIRQSFTRPLVPNDFERFNYYATRVHVRYSTLLRGLPLAPICRKQHTRNEFLKSNHLSSIR